jgi:hypothetical protein
MSTPLVSPPTAEELRRLALVRHLYGLGVAQSRGAEPTAGLAILAFHDAAESFLQLACERYGTGENKADFMRYWDLLAEKGITVPQREVMRRLNAARRGLKHQGILPAQVEIEGFRAAITNFLYDSAPQLLGVNFDQVTLVHLIEDMEARTKLEEAFKAFTAHDHQIALGEAAVAFILVQRANARRLLPLFPRHASPTLSGMVARSAGDTFAIHDLEATLGHSIRRIVENNGRAAEMLGEAVELMSRGLELRDYMLFKAHTPFVHQLIGGNMTIDWMVEPTADGEIVLRCLNFVVDAAVRLGV